MSKDRSKDAEAYDREYDAFLKQLEEFHQQRGTPFKRLPRINGKGVDLYLLYVVVTARGGWQKVNARCEWDELLEDFRLPAACVNSATALKHIYIRYLDAYERINFLGEDGEERGTEMDDGEDSRSMRAKRTIRSLNTVPLSYNHQQHNVVEAIRVGAGLSSALYRPSPYDKLALSLISPMPNEHDFAFNVCTILSNEGRHVLQLGQCPRLVEHMLAHAGVYRDWETQKYFLTNYKEAKGRSLVQFWIDSVEDRTVLDLLTPESFEKISSRALDTSKTVELEENNGAINNNIAHNLNSDILETLNNKENFVLEGTSDFLLNDSCLVSESKSDLVKSVSSGSREAFDESEKLTSEEAQLSKKDLLLRRLEKVLEIEGSDLKLGKEDVELFHLGRDLGQQDGEGTRISQILHIIRNLSFEEHNVSSLARSQTCLRFLVLCMCSQWGGLAVNALDTLGNIAPEVSLRDPKIDSCTASLITHICNGVSSPDRAFVLRSLEVLNKLAMNDPNEEILNNNIDPAVYGQICRYLTIHDIMLLIYTLECLYSLSSLGTPACNAIVRAKGSIHTLISLLTVEAQSYGPEACIGMKVVETVTGVVSEPEPANPPPPTPAVTPSLPTPTITVQTGTVVPATAIAVAAPAPPTVQQVTPVTPKPPITPITGDPKKIASRIVPPDVEEFVMEWVTKNYEAAPGKAIEQAIVYRHFAASMQSLGRKQGLNPVLLSNCVRKVFGTGVGPSRRPVDDGAEKWHYNGIRRRDGVVVPPVPEKKKGGRITTGTVPMYSPTPVLPAINTIGNQVSVPLTGSTAQIVTVSAQSDGIVSPSSPILKAQLSAPLRPSPPPPQPVVRGTQAMVTGTMPQGVFSSPQQQQSQQQSPQQPQQTNRSDNSALIKSLLANKVSRNLQKQQLQQQQVDNSQDSSSDSQVRKTSSFNGICNEIKRCEDDSNSFLSSTLNDKKVTSFEGILQNGIKSEIDVKEEEANDVSETKVKKNVLADLLEKTVGGDILNGVVDRDLRISDKGLEFVNHGQQVKVNGPVATNGQSSNESTQGGIKRPATPDNAPAKRIAIEDPRGAPGMDSRITLYVSQNGSESGEVISQGHQVVLSQGQQAPTVNPAQPQQMVVSQAVLAGQQVGTTQTMVTPQGQVILQRPSTQTGVIVQQGGQILTQGTAAGQVIQQVIQQGQSGPPQKVILHQGQLGQVLGGQVILSQGSGGQHQVMVQGGNNIQGQVIMQSVPHCQGQVFVQGSNAQGQFVVSGNQNQTVVVPGTQGQQQVVVSSAQGQTMFVAGNQGQPVVVSGQQGGSGQVMMPGNVGGTVLLAPQQQGSTAKTLIILPNPKMVISGNQHQGGQSQQLVLPRQMAGQQVVQVVSSGTTVPVATVTSAMRTVRAATPIADMRATPTPPPVQFQSNNSNSNSNISSSSTTAVYSVQTPASLPAAIAPAPAGPTAVPVSQTSVSQGPQTPHVPAPQVLSSGVARRPGNPSGLQYICEWRGCNQVFSSAGQVYHHACKVHCPPHIPEIQCGWSGCDTMTRRRFSAMTHLHDRHCNEQLLQILAVRRSQLAATGKTEIPIPQAPPPHPGYAPNAAFHAIKRHALEVINQRDAVEKEGPVTKSIRLTSALILRNLVIYSNTGKKLLRGFESELANVALSTMESSRTVAQILYDIRLPDHQGI
ncbi:AT-rich interactive domain-containing protein 2-like isoform X2 [Penaeus chinensis]|uniref:AT-rich interactive domain-containing protein 2-like isoform X2 n=1 Tax=Penaeus chinensis TaxID=139456 RepID=UPI001FB7FE2B|nr:AT-rich interactive domain-containing protein 2-like isoform X2 [Penaeus chinensis]